MLGINKMRLSKAEMKSSLAPWIGAAAIVALLGVPQPAHAGTMTITAPTVTPSTVNAYAAYSTNITVGGQQLDGSETLVIQFDTGVVLPASVSTSNITVDGIAMTSATVSGQQISCGFPVVRKNTTFRLDISDAAEIRSPSSTGTYTLTVSATIAGTSDSDTYTLSSASTTVTASSVTPSPSVASETAAYTIGFNVGASGYLESSVGTITVTFPSGTTVPSGTVTGASVNGTSASASGSGQAITLTTPVTVENEGAVTVAFTDASGISNPTAQTTTLNVKTSTETTDIASDNYTISSATSLSVTAVILDPTTVNSNAEYQLDFRVSSSGALTASTDTILITFPTNSDVPGTIATSAITVSSGGFSDEAAAIVVTSQEVAIVTPVDIANSGDVSLTFTTSAAIALPSNPANYTVDLRTSQDGTVTSNPYSVTASTTTLTAATVTLGDATPSTASSYTLAFNTGGKGRLWASNSTITVTFPSGTTVASPSSVTVNGTAASAVHDAGARTVTTTIPSAESIGNSAAVTLVIGSGITNPSAGTYSVQIASSPEPTKKQSQTFSVSSSTPVTISSVVLGTNTVNSNSTYTVNMTGASALASKNGDYIKVVFPEGTIVPSSITATDVTINGGANVSSVTTDPVGGEVTVFVNYGGNGTAPTAVVFTTAAAIYNPAVPSFAYYTLKVWTSQNPTQATSSIYQIVGKTGSTTSVTGHATPDLVSSSAAFSADFTTTSTGRVMGGTNAGSSDIYVDFDSGINVPGSMSASNVTVAGVTASDVAIGASGDGGYVRIGVPSGVTVANSTATSVYFNSSAGLTTTASPGTFNVTITTSADSTAASGNYTLSAVQNLAVTQATVSPLTVNAAAAYTVKFTTGSPTGALAADAGTITLTFPINTFVPSSIPKSDIKINTVTIEADPTTSTANRTIVITVPDAIAVNTQVTVQISAAAPYRMQ
jgi:trimeric autotransporter adhesin